MQEITNKTFFKNYAFFVLILAVLFTVLTYSIVLARKSWTNNLAVSVQKTLDEYEPKTWVVTEPVAIDKPVGFNCAAYSLTNKKTGDSARAVIVRITTLYGPLPAVFVYDKDGESVFAGYSSLHGRIREQLLHHQSDKRREYWQSKISEILGE